jgi:hypothetical protein
VIYDFGIYDLRLGALLKHIAVKEFVISSSLANYQVQQLKQKSLNRHFVILIANHEVRQAK